MELEACVFNVSSFVLHENSGKVKIYSKLQSYNGNICLSLLYLTSILSLLLMYNMTNVKMLCTVHAVPVHSTKIHSQYPKECRITKLQQLLQRIGTE